MTSSSAARLHPACPESCLCKRVGGGLVSDLEKRRDGTWLEAVTGTRRERQEAAIHKLKPVALLFMPLPPHHIQPETRPLPKAETAGARGLWAPPPKSPTPDWLLLLCARSA